MILRTATAISLTAALAAAQPAPTDFESLAPGARIDEARERVRDDALSGSERLEALRALIASLESRLALSDMPGETRARDAAELAESMLSLASWQGLQTTASVGILTPGMREEARSIARRALAAASAFDRVTATARTTDETLALRVALARARAGLMLVASSSDPDDRRAGIEAASAVRDVPTLLRTRAGSIDAGNAAENAEAEAQRLLILGRLALSEGAGASAANRFQAAREIALAPRTRAEAALAHAFAVRAGDGPDAALETLAALESDPDFAETVRNDPLVRIIHADATRRIALAGAEFARGDAIHRVAAQAGAPYKALAERGAPGIDPIALRALLLDKAAASAETLRQRLDAVDAPPPVVAFERIAAALTEPGDPSQTAGVLRLLRDPDAQAALGPFRADAVWRTAGALRAQEDSPDAQRDAAELLLSIPEFAPGDPRVPPALGAAAASAQRYAALTNESQDALALYERALRAALDRADDDALRVDSLRFELGRVLALRDRDEEAAALLSRVERDELGLRAAELLLSLAQRAGDPPRVSAAAETVQRRARALLADSESPAAQRALERAGAVGLSADLRAAISRADADAAGAAAQGIAAADAPGSAPFLRDEAVALIEELAAVERARGDLNPDQRARARVAAAIAQPLLDAEQPRDGDRVLHARAQRMTGDAQRARAAAATIEDVMARAGRAPELLAELAESLRIAGDDQRAFAIYRELSAATRPDDPRTRPLHWLAWGRMLAILADNNADGSRTATIRAQVERLRLIDPDLGGSPHRERITEALRRAADASPSPIQP